MITPPGVQAEPRDPTPVAAEPQAPRRGSDLGARILGLPTFKAFQTPAYGLLWVGQGAGSLSMWMDQVARGWLLYDLTGSPLQLGLLRGLQAVPLLFLSPVAGSAADRYNRRTQMIVAHVLDALLYAIVAFLIFSGLIQVWHVYVTAFVGGAISTFQQPSRAAMTADSVPPEHLTNAVAMGSVLFNVCRMTGPAMAGLLIAGVGIAASYIAQALLQVLSTILTVPLPSRLSFASRESSHRTRSHSFVRSIAEGWSFSWQNPTVRACLLITASASFFIIPFTTMLPAMAKDVLGVGAQGQGLLLTGMGIGAFCSAVLVATLGDRLPRGLMMLLGVTLYGLAVVVFSTSQSFPLSVALMVIVGIFHVNSHTVVQTVVQSYTPSELRGRTMAILQQAHVITLFGSMVLGAFATIAGAPTAIAVMGAAGALGSMAIFAFVPVARRIR